MAQNSKIEWCDHTVNLWWGCTKVHRGCDHCYAETLSKRWGNDLWGNEAPRKRIKSAFSDLAKYQKEAAEKGEFKKVFVGSMMDIFEKSKPLLNPIDGYTETGDLRARFFAELEANEYPNLIFLLLTKRPSNINKYVPEPIRLCPSKNIWYGASVVDHQSMMDVSRHMNDVNGHVFWSVEPLLEGISLGDTLRKNRLPQWIIVGGESGPGKRPFDVRWASQIESECSEYGVSYFFKQIDKVQPIPDYLMIREFPKEMQHHDTFV